MREVKVITDSCSDLTGELLERYNLDYARMTTVCEGKETPALLTWSPQEAHALYETMRNEKRVTTAQVPTEEFNRIFTKYLEKGCDIVYVGCSLKQSGSVNTGQVAAQALLKKYPGAKISCIDSQNASYGEGMLAIEAAKMAADGKGVDEITSHITLIRKTVQQYVTVHTLEYLKNAGRVSASSAFFGNLMGVKPILISDVNGVQTAVKKVKGRQNSFKEIVSLLKENIIDSENQTIYVAHSDCTSAELDSIVNLIRSEIPCRDIHVGYIGPIIGASIGPDAVGIWGFGNRVAYCMEE